jgi:NADPH-dependent curcumin reductase CurA
MLFHAAEHMDLVAALSSALPDGVDIYYGGSQPGGELWLRTTCSDKRFA